MYRSSSSHPTAGSSPLTRGKREVAKVRGCDLGLIPAHAGKTVGEELPGQIMWAHPRSRGENPRSNGSPTSIGGSSPLTRGKPRYRAMRARRRWLIPAHAGKTAMRRTQGRPTGAHPRSRGENGCVTACRMQPLGSSPLTRGKRLRVGAQHVTPRLIPAHAGKTPSSNRTCLHLPAHPRSRGENWAFRSRLVCCGGSSPLTRGKHAYLS